MGIELNTAEKPLKVTGLKLQCIYEENSPALAGLTNADGTSHCFLPGLIAVSGQL